MSIIIKDIEIPKNCTLCDSIGLNVAIGCPVMTGINGRATDCPLVEIPENHGRLIDADIAYDKIAEQEGGYYMDMDGVDKGLSEAPTILEAEEQE